MPPRLDYKKRPTGAVEAVGRVTQAAADVTASMFDLRQRIPRVREIEIAKIDPNPEQPRRHFPEEDHEWFKESLATFGLIQPITVKAQDGAADGRYTIVAGERRFRAARDIGWTTIAAIVSVDDRLDALALIENMIRKDLYAVEVALHLRRLQAKHGMMQKDLGEIVGLSKGMISRYISITRLPEEVLQDCLDNHPTTGRSILFEIAQLPEPEQQAEAWGFIKGGRTVRDYRSWLKRKEAPETEAGADDAEVRTMVARAVKRLAKDVSVVTNNRRWMNEEARAEMIRLRDALNEMLGTP